MSINNIPTSDELLNATLKHFPHYSVQLPEWADAKDGLPDNVPGEPDYDLEPLNCTVSLKKRIGALKKKYPDLTESIEANRPNESGPNADEDDPVTQVPHPRSDVRHVDPGQADPGFRANFKKVLADLQALQDKGRGDGELADKLTRAVAPLVDAEGLLATNGGSGPRGMQRLKLIFEWALCQVITVFGEINSALDTRNPQKYEAARTAYLELLKDLDDAEPETKQKVAPGISGYGRAIKWAYIIPLVHEGRIKGAKVVAKWNPHISSKGIPIPHS